MISCRKCQADNDVSSRFCEGCGAALDIACPACGANARRGAQFCGRCGAALAASPPQPLRDEGERKQVSVLFADIRGSTQLIQGLDPEAAMQQLDPVLQSMVGAVRQFGGVVNSVQGDGIMALFGAPVACEDHAVRACLAAHSMLDAARGNDPEIQIRVGIDSGEVVIRPTGPDNPELRPIGVIAHIAHRVEQHATPGSAFVTGRTARLARGYVDLAPHGRISIKGLSEPLELFRLLAAVARPSWEVRCSVHALNPFVGRHAELAQLSAALGRAGLGHGQVRTLIADAGFGKSRLAHEFLRTLPTGSWNVLRVAAVSHMAGAPYHLSSQLLRSWLRVDPADDATEVASKLKRTLALLNRDSKTDLAPLQTLLDLRVEDDSWGTLAPSNRRQRTIAVLRELIVREASVHPLILLVEDYHWADAQSTDVLHALAEAAFDARLLLLVTTRPERTPAWPKRNYCRELRLPALEPENAAALLRGLVDAAAAEGLQQKILNEAGGVPLFIEEIARSVGEAGGNGKRAVPRYSPAGSEQMQIPASLHAMIAARIDRLPPGPRKVLQIASVIGKDVAFTVLEAVAEMPRDHLQREISALVAAEFLYDVGQPAASEYSFRHALIQTVAYEEMLRRQRRELHAKVMSAMEAVFAGRLDEYTEVLAQHALRGEAWASAAHYAFKAGDRAIARGAWREAVSFYDNSIAALRELPSTPQTQQLSIEARLRLRIALPGLADLPRIARCLDEARAFAEQLNDEARLAEIDTSKCLTLTKMGQLEPACEAGRRAYARARDLGEPAAYLNASFALAQAYWYRGEFRQAEALLTARLAEVRADLRLKQTGTTGTASVLSLVCLAKTYAITGQFDKAFAAIDEARRAAEDTGKTFDLSYTGVGRGFCLLVYNEPRGAIAELEEALRLARHGDIALLIPSSQRYLARAYALAGQTQQAREVVTEAIERTKAAGLLGMQLWSSAALAKIEMQDPVGTASETLTATLQLAQQHCFRPLEAHLMRLSGELHAAKTGDDLRGAETSYRQSIRLADSLGMAPEASQARRELAACLRRAGRPEDATLQAGFIEASNS